MTDSRLLLVNCYYPAYSRTRSETWCRDGCDDLVVPGLRVPRGHGTLPLSSSSSGRENPGKMVKLQSRFLQAGICRVL